MNKQPIFFRSLFAVVVTLVFVWAMFPLEQQDIFEVFKKKLNKTDASIEKVLKLAEIKKKEKGVYAVSALDEAAGEVGVDLRDYITVKNAINNRDVINYLREQSSSAIRRGIDINGGVEFFLKLLPKEDENGKKIKVEDKNFTQYRDAAIEIIRNRLESQKIYETEISPAGPDFISLKAPIVGKEEKLKLLNLIKMSAKLEFSLVHAKNRELVSEYNSLPPEERNKVIPNGYRVMEMMDIKPGKKAEKLTYFIKRIPEMTGKNIIDAGPEVDQYGQRQIHLAFNGEGAAQFGKVTRENVDRQLAIILDGTLYSAPNIQNAIEQGRAQITGQFSKEEAENISNALLSGSLPMEIDVQGVFDTDPTLGESALKNSLMTGLVSYILVLLFMIFYYRKAGLIANVALTLNVVLLLGGFSAFNCTLTLAGIAGIILTIGMAVDANVLIYERIREELENNKTLANAVDAGFDRAFITILDSNLTTILIGIILMWQGTGAVKGFAIALTLGVALNLFTSLFITRLMFDIMAKYTEFRTLKMLKAFSLPNIDFLKIGHFVSPAMAIFAIFIIGACCYKGKAILGIDFTGGTLLTYEYKERVVETSVGDELVKAGFPSTKITYKTNMTQNSKIMEIIIPPTKKDGEVKIKEMNAHEQVLSILNKAFPKAEFKGGEEVSIGGLIGWEFSKKAIVAFILAIIGMIIYLSLRFEFAYGCAAMVALFHDVFIGVGVYVVFWDGEISMQVVAAALTILGFSVNDTIVIFDRIREDVGLIKNKTYKELVNLSINQTLSRTFITSFTVFLVILIMYVMGGNNLKDFVIVMLIGVVTGTLSTVFIATPIITVWHKRLGLKLMADQKEDNKVSAPART
ncbi:MAG: hypothetical protein A2X48_02770 [Lentisphaerae bacterium GWF2_49_21]|nr:MAG: hypothetical protein A2X48_02770 [Lentisphaerae bacterium GWF2_49_21]